MQPSSSSGSRRISRPKTSSGKSGGAGRTPNRTADFSKGRKGASPSSHADAGSKRRAKQKSDAKLINWSAGLIALFVTVGIASAATGVYARYSEMQRHIAGKQATLSDLQRQEKNGKRRLSQLNSPEGHGHILVNNGYIKPGDRLLLYPRTEAEKKAAAQSRNDLVTHEPAKPTGIWSRLQNAWRGFTSPSGVTTGR